MLKHQRRLRAAIGACIVGAMMTIGAPAGAAVDQVSGSVEPRVCDGSEPGAPANIDYAIPMAGDIEGCIYGYNAVGRELPSGVYHEVADETFVGTYQGRSGTFDLTEDFIIKFDRNGVPQWARCHHPIVRGSGTGDFEGVSGRLDFQDDFTDPANPITTYKGHLKFD